MNTAARSAAGALFALLSTAALAQTAPDPWPELVVDIFHSRPIAAADGVIALDAPARAEDAAIVPMTMRFADPTQIKVATLVIDQNPMPMAAAFTLGDKSGVGFIETRVRVNSYSNVHAVAETGDGKLRADAKFVKASGGCSAPAVKDEDEAVANLGKMKYREFKSADPAKREAQIMIRHPNSFGHADGPGLARLSAGAFHRLCRSLSGRRADLQDGRRHLALGRPDLPLHLCAERREDDPRRSP